MANDLIINDEVLKQIADKTRELMGTSEKMKPSVIKEKLKNLVLKDENLEKFFNGETDYFPLPIGITNCSTNKVSYSKVIVPDTYTRCPSFSNNVYVEYIILPNKINLHGYGTRRFQGCTNLKEVNIPSATTAIPEEEFASCSSLQRIFIPSKVYSLAYSRMMTDPSPSKPEHCFRGCYNVESIVVDEANETYDSRDNCNAVINTEYNRLVVACKNTVIPTSVVSIGRGAFLHGETFIHYTIPNHINSVAACAFQNCAQLESITIPNSVTNMKNGTGFVYGTKYYVFHGCDSLKTINLEDGFNANEFSVQKTDGVYIELTQENLIDILNALKDRTGESTYKIYLGASNLAKLTNEQKAIATNKNWTLA